MTPTAISISIASDMAEVHPLILHQGIENARRATVASKTDRLCVDAAYGVLSDERGRVTSVKLVENRCGFEMAIGQAAWGGIWSGSGSLVGGASSAMASSCM